MKRWRPSLGFSLVVLSYGLTVAFFAWGFATPPLDRVWQLHHHLKIGSVYALGAEDREILGESMRRHPALASALLSAGQIGIISAHRGGWIDTPEVTIIRTPRSSARRLTLEVQTPPQHIPYDVELTGSSGFRLSRQIVERGVVHFELPPPPSESEIVTLKLEGKGLRADPSSLAVRVSFDLAEASAEQEANDDDDDDEEDDE